MPELTLKLADQVLQTLTIDKDEIKIGRARDNDIVIENLNISRHHVSIRQQNGLYYIKDNSSSNGTLVNGIKVSKTEIIDGDVIGLGKYKIHFKNLNTLESKFKPAFSEVENTIMAEPQVSAQLQIINGKLEGHTFPLTKFETTIGKSPTNDIVFLDDWLLAKQQATIVKRGNNEFQIIDLGGLRKVKINGTNAKRNQVLNNQDTIEFGSIRCIFQNEMSPSIATGRIPEEMLDNSLILSVSSLAGNFRPPEDQIEENSNDITDENLNHLIFQANSISELTDDELLHKAPPFELDESEIDIQEAAFTNHSTPPLAQQTENTLTPLESKSSSRIRRRNRRERELLKNRNENSSANHAALIQSDSLNESPVVAASSSNNKIFGNSQENNSSNPGDNTPLNSEKEIQIWEAALKNPSAVIRKQAARMLKSLTGKDYDVE